MEFLLQLKEISPVVGSFMFCVITLEHMRYASSHQTLLFIGRQSLFLKDHRNLNLETYHFLYPSGTLTC